MHLAPEAFVRSLPWLVEEESALQSADLTAAKSRHWEDSRFLHAGKPGGSGSRCLSARPREAKLASAWCGLASPGRAVLCADVVLPGDLVRKTN